MHVCGSILLFYFGVLVAKKYVSFFSSNFFPSKSFLQQEVAFTIIQVVVSQIRDELKTKAQAQVTHEALKELASTFLSSALSYWTLTVACIKGTRANIIPLFKIYLLRNKHKDIFLLILERTKPSSEQDEDFANLHLLRAQQWEK